LYFGSGLDEQSPTLVDIIYLYQKARQEFRRTDFKYPTIGNTCSLPARLKMRNIVKNNKIIIMTKLLNPLFFFIAIFLISCSNDPKKKFDSKSKIGVCQENQGMVTFEATLYIDSTFYIPSNALISYSYGEFKINGETIQFKTNGGDKHLCDKYNISIDKLTLTPIDCQMTESLNILFSNY
jgi:hypothetical protein